MSLTAIHRAILRSAAVLVPETQRADWLAEWRGELWYAGRDPHGQNVTAFCMGAFRDAYWLWRADPCPDRSSLLTESPTRCLGLLAALGAICFSVALLLPAARPVLLGALYPRNLVMLTPAGQLAPDVANGFFDPFPSVSLEQFEALKAHEGGQFTALAFYTPELLPVQNLDRNIQENDAILAALPAHTLGFVVGRLRYNTLRNNQYRFVRLPDRSWGVAWAVLMCFTFACVMLRAMISHPPGGHPRKIGPRRGLFLAAKTLLILPIVIFGSLDLGSFGKSISPIFIHFAFMCSLIAARWILADQRKRCPVCLGLLANPVRIGESSHILLEWHGTELMCLRGHGMLYVPEWPPIWTGRQRWLELDPSWGGFFP
jgi:hypothetical protein